jgi:hypothetical protein
VISALFVGDGDELVLFDCVQKSLGVQATDDEYAVCWTMGDMEALVLRHASDWEGAQKRCMTSMAFHELRRASECESPRRLRPSSPVALLGFKPAELAQKLGEAGLRIRFNARTPGVIGALICMAGVLAFLPTAARLIAQPTVQSQLLFALTAIAIMVGALAVKKDRGSFGCMQTAGDVARHLAGSNLGHFTRRGGRCDADGVWRALCEAAAGEGGCNPDDIGRETLLIHPRKKWFQRVRRK